MLPIGDWIRTLGALAGAGTASVVVTIVAVKGSIPRPSGTRMIVTEDAIHGTIGGGQLEYKAIAIARGVLAGDVAPALQRFPLGASLGQCCGGVVQLLFEPVRTPPGWLAAVARLQDEGADAVLVTPLVGDAAEGRLVVAASDRIGTLGSPADDDDAVRLAREILAGNGAPRIARVGADATNECFFDVVRAVDFRIVLFGAGHVGRALVRTLAGIRCRVTWVDTRDDAFPADIPDNATAVVTDTPESEVDAAEPGTHFLVMTHSHAQDEILAERILRRDDAAYFGLIGSVAKRRQFERRMEARGMPRQHFERMTCPIGIAGIVGKEPEVIAIAVAAELLMLRDRARAAATGDNRRSA